MRALLLGVSAPLAAIAFSAGPASAQFAPQPGIGSGQGASVTVHRGGDHHKRHDRRRQGRFPTTVVVGDIGWNDNWALNNNRSWEPDSFNDWWHDRPSRAYPRWFQNNSNCDRVWWGGGVWRCNW